MNYNLANDVHFSFQKVSLLRLPPICEVDLAEDRASQQEAAAIMCDEES
jgi:hypothetical protein